MAEVLTAKLVNGKTACPETGLPMRWDIDSHHHGVCAYQEKCNNRDCVSERDFSPGCETFTDPEIKGLERENTERRICARRFPLQSDYWAVEPGVGRVVNGLSGRVDRLKALGNAVVPQQVYPIFRAIAETEANR